MMFGSIGASEMLVLLGIGLLVFGPRRLPEIGRTLGKAMVEFRRAAMELRTSIEREINLEELKETTQAISREMDEGVRKMTETARQAIPEEIEELKTISSVSPAEAEGGPRTGDVAKKD